MIQSRNAFIALFVSFSLVLCLFTVIPLLAQKSSWGAWAGLVIGGSLGVWSCLYLVRTIRGSKASNDGIRGHTDLNRNQTTSRWLILSAVGGTVLARLVSNFFDPQTQSLINNAVSAWVIVSFSGAAFIAWRYLPKDW